MQGSNLNLFFKIEGYVGLLIYLFSIITGVLLIFSFPPFHGGFLIWIAFIPLLYAIFWSDSSIEAGRAGFLSGLIFYAFHLSWFYRNFHLWSIGLFIVLSFFIGAFAYLIKYLSPQIRIKKTLFAIPIIWVAIEFFRSELWFLGFSWLSIGYSQSDFRSILQFASILGIYGISFVILLVNSLIFHFFRRRFFFLLFAAIFIIAGISYWGRNRIAPIERGEIKVACIQSETFQAGRFIELSRLANSNNPQFIIWPEYSSFILPDDAEVKIDYFKGLARELKTYIIIGLMEFKGKLEERFRNFAVVISPQGEIVGEHTKVHLVPFIEDWFQKGKKASIISTEHGRIGLQICFDADFVDLARKQAKRGAEVIIVPTLDPSFWGRKAIIQHASMMPFRAVESGRYLVRATAAGISMIIDPFGRVLKSLPFRTEGVLFGEVSFRKKNTFYHLFGWVFPSLCLLMAVFIMTKRWFSKFFI